MKDVVDLPKASVEKVDNDILITHYKSHMAISEDDAKEIDNAYLTMSQGGDMFVIVDMTAGGTKIDKEAEYYFAKKCKMMPYIKAMAVVKDQKPNLLARILSKKAIFPQKEFISAEDAKAWISSLRN
ncbi:hypothetical protein K6119_08705 [Paracrocinitomix mangrovi]|uniref:DUF7793 family protein n=1 Tax=Paracrocinitomix mangrovi TaxID=2862509 RepID=UPI001C8D99C9|nr:hypothetical protein [Paracrocinitomix mangrovi]UKN03592.1 hypothetical protein K6119_08705 [Paracrocinitomix mangrovi]